MSDRLSNVSGDTELLNDDDISVVLETPSQVIDYPSWADHLPEDEAPLDSPELFLPSSLPLPIVLADLMSSGVCFESLPVERWSRD